MIPVRNECMCSIQRALKCARCKFKLYLFTEVYDVHSSVCEDAAQRKSVNECSEVKYTSTDFPCSGSREQRTRCRDHINQNTVHARSSLLTSWLSESGVLTKRDMQNMRAGGGGPRTGIGNRWINPYQVKTSRSYHHRDLNMILFIAQP